MSVETPVRDPSVRYRHYDQDRTRSQGNLSEVAYIEMLTSIGVSPPFFVVNTEDTLLDKLGADVIAVCPETEQLVRVDVKKRSKNFDDVFVELFHLRPLDPGAVKDSECAEFCSWAVHMVASALKRGIERGMSFQKIFQQMNRTLTTLGKPFRIEPGWCFNDVIASNVVLTLYPDGAVSAYDKKKLQVALAEKMIEGLQDKFIKSLFPTYNGDNGYVRHVTQSVAIDAEWCRHVLNVPYEKTTPGYRHRKEGPPPCSVRDLTEDRLSQIATLVEKSLAEQRARLTEQDPHRHVSSIPASAKLALLPQKSAVKLCPSGRGYKA